MENFGVTFCDTRSRTSSTLAPFLKCALNFPHVHGSYSKNKIMVNSSLLVKFDL